VRETILLVEDDEAVRDATRTFLAEYGYRVLEAHDGAAALELLGRPDVSVDAVVTDVVMPRMGGRELVERLRATRPEIPVLYVSGYTDSARVRDHLSKPGVLLLPKPFTAAALAQKLGEVLARPAAS
jgi:CheY-like chemotaxis protein